MALLRSEHGFLPLRLAKFILSLSKDEFCGLGTQSLEARSQSPFDKLRVTAR
jgi:hypothetical protein